MTFDLQSFKRPQKQCLHTSPTFTRKSQSSTSTLTQVKAKDTQLHLNLLFIFEPFFKTRNLCNSLRKEANLDKTKPQVKFKDLLPALQQFSSSHNWLNCSTRNTFSHFQGSRRLAQEHKKIVRNFVRKFVSVKAKHAHESSGFFLQESCGSCGFSSLQAENNTRQS